MVSSFHDSAFVLVFLSSASFSLVKVLPKTLLKSKPALIPTSTFNFHREIEDEITWLPRNLKLFLSIVLPARAPPGRQRLT